MKIKAITPLGTFVSVEQSLTGPQMQNLREMLTERLGSLTYYACVTEEGPVYLGPNVVKDSIFVILN